MSFDRQQVLNTQLFLTVLSLAGSLAVPSHPVSSLAQDLSNPLLSILDLFRVCLHSLLHKVVSVRIECLPTSGAGGCQAKPYQLDSATVAAKRQQWVAPNHALMYKDPLHIVSGKGTWLYDNSGNAYLDCVNNVAHVGHSNAKVGGRPDHRVLRCCRNEQQPAAVEATVHDIYSFGTGSAGGVAADVHPEHQLTLPAWQLREPCGGAGGDDAGAAVCHVRHLLRV